MDKGVTVNIASEYKKVPCDNCWAKRNFDNADCSMCKWRIKNKKEKK